MEHLEQVWNLFLCESAGYRVLDWVILSVSALWVLWIVAWFLRILCGGQRVITVQVNDQTTQQLIRSLERMANLNSKHYVEAVQSVRLAHQEALDTVKQVVSSFNGEDDE